MMPASDGIIEVGTTAAEHRKLDDMTHARGPGLLAATYSCVGAGLLPAA